MYTNPQNGQSTVAAVAAHRLALTGLLATSLVITDAEYHTAAQRIASCQDLATLQKWYRNCIREVARREEEVDAPTPTPCATPGQKREIQQLVNNVLITRAEKTQVLLALPQLTSPQAVAVIGALWAKLMARATAYPAPPAAGGSQAGDTSYATAA